MCVVEAELHHQQDVYSEMETQRRFFFSPTTSHQQLDGLSSVTLWRIRTVGQPTWIADARKVDD